MDPCISTLIFFYWIEYLRLFSNNSVNFRCFTNHDHINSLDQFFGNLFIKLLKNSNDLSSSKILSENDVSSQIEDLFSFPSRLPIPTTLEVGIHRNFPITIFNLKIRYLSLKCCSYYFRLKFMKNWMISKPTILEIW